MESAWAISSLVRSGVELWGLGLEAGEKAALGGRNGPVRPRSSAAAFQPRGGKESRGGARPEANRFAVHKCWGVAESRKEDKCLFFVTLLARK